MGIEQNKHLAQQFIDLLSANDIAGALDLMTDDATWWIAGKPDHLPAAGLYSKAKIARLLRNMVGQLQEGLKMTVKSLVAEGDRVAMEAESYGKLQNGRVYQQEYHFSLTIDEGPEGKIKAVKEYLDTQHVYAIWFQQ